MCELELDNSNFTKKTIYDESSNDRVFEFWIAMNQQIPLNSKRSHTNIQKQQ